MSFFLDFTQISIEVVDSLLQGIDALGDLSSGEAFTPASLHS